MVSFTLALAIDLILAMVSRGIFFEPCQLASAHSCVFLPVSLLNFTKILLLVQFVIVFYDLPLISDHDSWLLDMFSAGTPITALILLRLFVQDSSIPSGQMEVALSQGFTYIRIISQFQVISLSSIDQLVNLIKNTSQSCHHLWSGLDVCDSNLILLNGNIFQPFRCCSSTCPMLPCCPVWLVRWSKPTKSLFTLGGYYGILF